MTSVPPTQPPAAPEGDVRLTEAERAALTRCDCGHDIGGEHNSYGCYGGGPACGCNETDDRPGVNFAAVERIVAERVRVVEGERDAALDRYAEREGRWHWNLIREQNAIAAATEATARAESAEAAHTALVAEIRQRLDDMASSANESELRWRLGEWLTDLAHPAGGAR